MSSVLSVVNSAPVSGDMPARWLKLSVKKRVFALVSALSDEHKTERSNQKRRQRCRVGLKEARSRWANERRWREYHGNRTSVETELLKVGQHEIFEESLSFLCLRWRKRWRGRWFSRENRHWRSKPRLWRMTLGSCVGELGGKSGGVDGVRC